MSDVPRYVPTFVVRLSVWVLYAVVLYMVRLWVFKIKKHLLNLPAVKTCVKYCVHIYHGKMVCQIVGKYGKIAENGCKIGRLGLNSVNNCCLLCFLFVNLQIVTPLSFQRKWRLYLCHAYTSTGYSHTSGKAGGNPIY